MEHFSKDVRRFRELRAPARMALAVLAALTLIAIAAAARAEVRPGDLITPVNAPKVKDLVSPGVYYKVLNGMAMKIVPSGRIDWPTRMRPRSTRRRCVSARTIAISSATSPGNRSR